MKAGYGSCVNIRPVASRGVTQIIIECPAEHHVNLTQLFYDKDVLITLATDAVKEQVKAYGVVSSEAKPDSEQTQKQEEASDTQGQGVFAQKLYRIGYFYNPKLWEALEQSRWWTPKDHDLWIRGQNCVFSEQSAWKYASVAQTPCHGDVCGHHVRDASNAGTGIKPHNRYEVPLCFNHHVPLVHDHNTRELKDFLMKQAGLYQSGVVKTLIKNFLQIESLSELTKQGLEKWQQSIGFEWAVNE